MTGPAEARVFIAVCEWHIVHLRSERAACWQLCIEQETRFHRWSATIGMRRDACPGHRQ
jgi:hypothetical protein